MESFSLSFTTNENGQFRQKSKKPKCVWSKIKLFFILLKEEHVIQIQDIIKIVRKLT